MYKMYKFDKGNLSLAGFIIEELFVLTQHQLDKHVKLW